MFHSSDRVLVAIVSNQRDFETVRDEGWYRIPQKHASQSTTEAAALAVFQQNTVKYNQKGIPLIMRVETENGSRRQCHHREPSFLSTNPLYLGGYPVMRRISS